MTNNKRNTATPRQPRRKVRRRLHKGRLALVLTVLAIIIVGIMTLISRCSDGSVVRSAGDFEIPVTDALKAGREDARKVMSTAPGSMEREEALLFIRSREHALRDAGHAHAADDYINSAKEELKNLNIY